MKKRVTIKDVADLANVSTATVSYVLNDVDKVSRETKNRVLEAVEKLNYYPDYTAISLSKRKSNIIGVIIPLMDDSPLSVFKNNQYYDEFISGVEFIARSQEYDIMITGGGNPKDCKNWIRKRNLDGLIFLGTFPEELYLEVKELEIPIVLIDTYEQHTKSFNNVKINDILGGYLATKHLIDLNHKDIAFVATDLELSPVDASRFQGFQKALQEAGLQVTKSFIFESQDIAFEVGMQMGQELLRRKQPITGIVTVSDVLAIGMIKAFNQYGKKVPDDYSIVGFDGLSISQYTIPSLTTVKQDIVEKGKLATDLLIKEIESPSHTNKTIELPIELIVRNSTRKVTSKNNKT